MTAGMKIVLTVAIRWKSNPKGTTPPSQWDTRYPLCGDDVIALGGLTLSGEDDLHDLSWFWAEFHLSNTKAATICLFQCIGLFCLWCHVTLVGDTQSFTAVI